VGNKKGEAMKTEQKLRQLIQDQIEKTKNDPSKAELKRIKKKVSELRFALKDIQTNPTKENLEGQLKDIEHKIAVLGSRYPEWASSNSDKVKELDSMKKVLTFYDKLNGVPRLRTQARQLKFLLAY
jgi:hypothetical protein